MDPPRKIALPGRSDLVTRVWDLLSGLMSFTRMDCGRYAYFNTMWIKSDGEKWKTFHDLSFSSYGTSLREQGAASRAFPVCPAASENTTTRAWIHGAQQELRIQQERANVFHTCISFTNVLVKVI